MNGRRLTGGLISLYSNSCVDGSIRIYDIRMGTLITDQIFGM